MSSSLQPQRLWHTMLPCPSPAPGVFSNSYPLSQWYHPTSSSSVTLFSCLQSFPASGSFPMSQFFAPGGRSVGALASALVLPMNIQGSFSLGLTGLIELLSVQSSLKSLLQHHDSKTSVLWHSAFFLVQHSHPFMTTEKNTALTIWSFVSKVTSLLFNMLSRFVSFSSKKQIF